MKPGDVLYLIMCNGDIQSIHMTFDGANKAFEEKLKHWESGPLPVRKFSDGTFQVLANGAVHRVLKNYYVITKPLEE